MKRVKIKTEQDFAELLDYINDDKKPIKRISIIKGLNLDNEQINSFVKKLVDNTSVETLNLRANNLAEKAALLCPVLENNNTLTSLVLGDNCIDDETGAVLVSALENNFSLTDLNLYGNKIGNKTACVLSQVLKKNFSLVSICLLGNSQINNKGLSDINDALKLNHHVTDITANQFHYTGVIDNNLDVNNPYVKRNIKKFQATVDNIKDVCENKTAASSLWILRYFQEASPIAFKNSLGDDYSSYMTKFNHFISQNFFHLIGLCKDLTHSNSKLPTDLWHLIAIEYIKIVDVWNEPIEANYPLFIEHQNHMDLNDDVALSGHCFGQKCAIM